MKKLLSVIFVLVMMFCLAGCGNDLSDSQYVGTWHAVEYSYAGVSMTPEYIGESNMTLDADGKLTVDFMGEEGSGSWEETDTGIKISSLGLDLDCISDGTAITLEYSGVTILFEKDGAEGASSDQTTEENAEDNTEENAENQ